MTREQIERRIVWVQGKLEESRHPKDLASLNQTMEKLIFMEAEDESDDDT